MRSSEKVFFIKLLKITITVAALGTLLFISSQCNGYTNKVFTYKIKYYWEITPVYRDEEPYYARVSNEKKEKI